MNDYLEQVQAAVDRGLYYLSLFSSLALPDICGALESSNGEANKERYIAWFDKYVGPRYEGFLSGEDCWFYRCAILHQGRRAHARTRRIMFLEPASTQGMTFHCNIFNDALNIDVTIFCSDILGGVRQWLREVEGTELYETNHEQMLRRHPDGLPPYVLGVPVIG